MKDKFFAIVPLSVYMSSAAIIKKNFIEKNKADAFPVVTSSQTTSIYADSNADQLLRKAASLLQNGIELVTGKKPGIISSIPLQKIVLDFIGVERKLCRPGRNNL